MYTRSKKLLTSRTISAPELTCRSVYSNCVTRAMLIAGRRGRSTSETGPRGKRAWLLPWAKNGHGAPCPWRILFDPSSKNVSLNHFSAASCFVRARASLMKTLYEPCQADSAQEHRGAHSQLQASARADARRQWDWERVVVSAMPFAKSSSVTSHSPAGMTWLASTTITLEASGAAPISGRTARDWQHTRWR
jgi:hypothetical protein